jgi:hypothetical protein
MYTVKRNVTVTSLAKNINGTVTSLAKNINDSVHIILEPCSISIYTRYIQRREVPYIWRLAYL